MATKEKHFERVKEEIEAANKALSGDDYGEFLAEVENECAERIEALDEDEKRRG